MPFSTPHYYDEADTRYARSSHGALNPTLRHTPPLSLAQLRSSGPSFLFFFVAAFKSGVKNARREGTKAQIVFFKKRDPGVNVSSRAKKKKKRKRVSLPFLAVTEVPVVLSRAAHIPRL